MFGFPFAAILFWLFSKCHVIKISKIFGDFVPRDSSLCRVFSRRSAILKIVEEKALGTRLMRTAIAGGIHRADLFSWISGYRQSFALFPGVVNRTFENRTQSNSIELNPWIEFDWVRQSNEIEHHTFSEFDFRTNRIQSNKSNSIELNPSDWVRLSSETELNRTQLNGFRSIGSGESIQREP